MVGEGPRIAALVARRDDREKPVFLAKFPCAALRRLPTTEQRPRDFRLQGAADGILATHRGGLHVVADGSTGMRAIGYVRVSTAEQATAGVSLDAQRARIAAWGA